MRAGPSRLTVRALAIYSAEADCGGSSIITPRRGRVEGVPYSKLPPTERRSDAAVAENEMSIDPLGTSITTNMLGLAMACVCRLWLCASLSSASRNPRFTI